MKRLFRGILWSTALISFALLPLVIVVIISPSSTPVHCAGKISQQMPQSLVKVIEALENNRHINDGEDSSSTTTILSRRITGGQVEAVVGFSTHLCGFYGGIDYVPSGTTSSMSTNTADTLKYVHNNIEMQPSTGYLCVSNTVPNARLLNGVIVLTVACDRMYSVDQASLAHL